jgi:hypothetical protein
MPTKRSKTLAVIIASIISAGFYRLGGIGGKYFKSWMRDWLIPPLAYGLLYFLRPPVNLIGWLMILPAIALTGAALTTYLDSIFGYDNFAMHGFLIGLGAFPMFWYGSAWWIILVRAILLGAFMGGLNWWVHKYSIKYSDWIEELGRGFVIVLSIPLLLI